MGSLGQNGTTNVDSELAVAKIYNSAIAACAIPAAWEVGMLDALAENKTVDVPKFSEEHGLDPDAMLGLAVSMAVVSVVKLDDTTITPGIHFDEAFKTKSMFHWLTLSSGGLFARMNYEVKKENRQGDIHRDPKGVAYSCRELNRQFYDPIFWDTMSRLDYKFNRVVDLGCGSGARLQQILKKYPETTGLGIDIAGGAIKFAESEAKKGGFGDRLSFVTGDTRHMAYREEFADVDLLTSFLMGHDFWPRDECIANLRNLRKLFPKVRRFLLGDETRGLLHSMGSKPPTKEITETNVPIFPLGLELGHVLMEVYIPTMQEWHDVFEEGGWRCIKANELQKPAFACIFELVPID